MQTLCPICGMARTICGNALSSPGETAGAHELSFRIQAPSIQSRSAGSEHVYRLGAPQRRLLVNSIQTAVRQAVAIQRN